MYLSKLEIFGFKSFANKTVVNFTSGITGIVGPNGCGKTNIVDAIRWCLGEQKSSTLRSDKMENVIFNGTKNKKPMGMAEVALTLVNNRGVLPTEYTEITITRRIFRSGESEYLLNGNVCRLKDITSLFMDTGMGTNAYSVIELKMIESILSSRNDERRNMFEEAAGVNKYKLRRRLSLNKLDDVKSDLTRVNDIYSEVEKKVSTLERHTKKADKYNTLTALLREKEFDLAEREYSYNMKVKEEKTCHKTELSERKHIIDDEIKSLDSELTIYRERIKEIESELKIKRAELSVKNEKLHSLRRNLSISEERAKNLNANIIRFRNESEELNYQKEENEDIITEGKNESAELEIEVRKLAEALSSDNIILIETENKYNLCRSRLKEKNEEIQAKFRDHSVKENSLKSLKSQYEKNFSEIKRIDERIQKLTTSIAKTVGFLEDLSNDKSALERKLAESELEYTRSKNLKDEIEKNITRLKEIEIQEKGRLVNLNDKIDFLKTLINNLEGVSKGSKILLENKNLTEKGITLLADTGTAGEEFRFALEAALRNVLNNLLVEGLDDLRKAINFLKKNDLGKASFFIASPAAEKKNLLNKVFDFKTRQIRKKIEKEPSFAGWAQNYIETDDKWRHYFEKALSGTAIVKDINSAIELSRKYKEWNFSTLEGDLVQTNGIIEAGSIPKLDETLLGRKQMLEQLIADYPKLEAGLTSLKSEIEKQEEELENIDLEKLSAEGKLLVTRINNIEKQIAQLEYESTKFSEEIEKAREELNRNASEGNKLDNDINALTAEIEELRILKAGTEESLRILEAETSEAEREYKTKVSENNQKKIDLERNKGKLQNNADSVKRAENTLENIIKSIEKRAVDLQQAEQELESLSIIIEETGLDYDELFAEQKTLKADEEKIEQMLKAVKQESSSFENKLRDIRTERQNISDNLYDIDIKLNQIELKTAALITHIKEDYAEELKLKEFENQENFNFNSAHEEVATLKNQIKNLGPINLLAFSEYEEEKDRLDFLTGQRNDLIDAEKDLIKTINEINLTAQTLFVETFEQIRQNFVAIFRGLFNPGDEADLKLQEDADPLEAKIEIIAKPKGKRPTSIELLSGGEKTLTATALLFAIYLVKPSPFCILDEVDAPLDDANVDRFTKLIGQFVHNTQFIMVTHNKRTMEAAETMYGVTMQEEGISRLVGVRFEEVESEAN